MFGRGNKQPKMNTNQGAARGGWAWRSFKKLIITVLMVGMLATTTLITNLDHVWQGTMSMQEYITEAYLVALSKGFSEFIPNVMAFFQNLAVNQPAQAFILNFIPNFLVFATVFLWMSIIADTLDMQKHEAIPSIYVFLATLILLSVFSLSAMGFGMITEVFNIGG